MDESLRLRGLYERRLAALADEVELWLRAGARGGDATERLADAAAADPRRLEAVVRDRLVPDDQTARAILEGASGTHAGAPRDAAAALALRQLVSLAGLRARARDYLALPVAVGARCASRAAATGSRARLGARAEGRVEGPSPGVRPQPLTAIPATVSRDSWRREMVAL